MVALKNIDPFQYETDNIFRSAGEQHGQVDTDKFGQMGRISDRGSDTDKDVAEEGPGDEWQVERPIGMNGE